MMEKEAVKRHENRAQTKVRGILGNTAQVACPEQLPAGLPREQNFDHPPPLSGQHLQGSASYVVDIRRSLTTFCFADAPQTYNSS